MRKDELVKSVSGKADLSKAAANRAVDAVFDSITSALHGGSEVRLVGFGTFSLSGRAGSEGRNPRTGEKIKIAASKQAKFKPGKGRRDHFIAAVEDSAGSAGPDLNTSNKPGLAKLLDDLRERGALKGSDVANMTSVSPATVSRWTAGKAFPQPKTQLLISDLRYIVDRLAEYYSPDETRLWLYAKHPQLNGERAIDLIHAGRTAEILSVIEGLDESTYA